MANYRAAVIGLGWMGMLYDLAERIPDGFEIEDVDRPTPDLDLHRRFYHHDHPGNEGLPSSYSEALWSHPEVNLVAGVDRDAKRLEAFRDRYGIASVYTDAEEMLRHERPDIVAVATNTKGRADLVCLAVTYGARGILTDKPMCHTLAEADRMVKTCSEAGVPLSCGAITTTHPSFARAKELIRTGTLGEIQSAEAAGPFAQHQNWTYFLESPPTWVSGVGDLPRRGQGTDEFNGPGGSDEFTGQGIMVTTDGMVVHFRKGAPGVRLSGTTGEIQFSYGKGWQIWQQTDVADGTRQQVEMPWPEPQFVPPYGAIYSLNDVIDSMESRLEEPKNSGRRVAMALEVEIALKQSSAREGARIGLPLADRSLGLNYDWFR